MNTSQMNRKELARELRRSHFMMGSHKDKEPKSEYIEKYVENPFAFRPFAKEDGIKLRRTHFILGTDENQTQYESLYKAAHQNPPKDFAQSTLNAEKKKDLRTHHFNYGNDKPDLLSENHENYIKRQIPTETWKEMKDVKERNKSEHYKFPDDSNYFSSVYTEHFNKNLDPSQSFQDRKKIKEETSKQLAELRASHILYGTDYDQFGTTSRNTFVPIKSEVTKLVAANLTKTNFVLGDDEQPTESLYKHTHKALPMTEKAALDPALKKDLRAHHFKYGDESSQWMTTANHFYKEPSKDSGAIKTQAPLLWQNHFYLGDDKLSYNTSYKENHKEFGAEAVKATKPDMSSKIKFGYDNPEQLSETHGKFINHVGAKKAQLEEENRKDLRKSHFNFGDQMEKTSYSHAMHTDLLNQSKQINKGGDIKSLASDLRKHHYSFGYNGGNGTTSHRDNFKDIGGSSSTLQKELADDLKKHHFALGPNNGMQKKSLYSEHFDWKQPIEG